MNQTILCRSDVSLQRKMKLRLVLRLSVIPYRYYLHNLQLGVIDLFTEIILFYILMQFVNKPSIFHPNQLLVLFWSFPDETQFSASLFVGLCSIAMFEPELHQNMTFTSLKLNVREYCLFDQIHLLITFYTFLKLFKTRKFDELNYRCNKFLL
jgi:hypothetical protein